MLKPVNRRALVDDVEAQLRAAIIDGGLKPGERLVEDNLATRLGVSRAPVRDALRALEREGLVAPASGRGKVVTSLSGRDAWEVYSLRGALESLAVHLVLESPPADLWARLETILDLMDSAAIAEDRTRLSALDVEFHQAICQASGHARLIQSWESMAAQIRLLSHQVLSALYADLPGVRRRHQSLLDALKAGDAERAQAMVTAHIDRAALQVSEHVGP